MKLSALFIATVAAEKVNWWSSFDKKGWSTCNKGSNGYMYMNGLYRNNCHKLYCIEEVDCRGDGGDSCYDANWWSSFDKRGWSTCADGSYMSGLYRNTCHSLYCIESAKCCKQTNVHKGVAKSQTWGDCYNHNWWRSFDKKGWSSCSADYSLAGLYRNSCHDLYCLEEAKCCKPKDVHPNQVVANWWRSFDKKGWSNCAKHGENYKYIDALYRNSCNKLYCIEEARCSTSIHHDDEQKCVNQNWWSSFDKRGWSTCADGSFISGLYRNSCHELYCLESAKCCTSKTRKETWAGCYNSNWWSSFDKRGWSGCKVDYHLTGLFRNTCHDLYCIEMGKCCKSNVEMKPVDCVGSWSKFGTCSKTCGTGAQQRTFTTTTQVAHGGNPCEAAHFDVESKECATNECPEVIDIELVIEETEESFTKQKKQSLINKIAKQLGLKPAEVQITVGLKANPTDYPASPARRLLDGLLITVTFNVMPSKVASEIAKLESKSFAKATGATFVQFKPTHGSSICATCKWTGMKIQVVHYINAQKTHEKGLKHKCWHTTDGGCKCLCM